MTLDAGKCGLLIQQSIKLVKSFDPQVAFMQQIQHHQINQAVKIPIDHLKNRGGKIAIRNVFVHPLLRISIFSLPFKKVMKLHDHPSMNVLTYVMRGSMQAHIFNPQPASQLFKRETYTFCEGDLKVVPGLQNEGKSQKDNLHEFCGEREECVFMDIIFPDYSEDSSRKCSFFDYEHQGLDLYALRQNMGYNEEMIYF